MANYAIEEIRSMDSVMCAKLRAADIVDTDTLRRRSLTPDAQAELAEATGLDATLILAIANTADLLRINGITPEFATLLEAVDVDTVAGLANRNPGHLAADMARLNRDKKVTRCPPTEDEVAHWVTEAKALSRGSNP